MKSPIDETHNVQSLTLLVFIIKHSYTKSDMLTQKLVLLLAVWGKNVLKFIKHLLIKRKVVDYTGLHS